jgi:hypothetical protein
VERGGAAARILPNPGGIDWDERGGGRGEYFLLENRQRQGFDAYLPGSGLLIWHVSERRPGNAPADFAKRLLGVVETDGAPGDLGRTTNQGSVNLGEQEDFWPYGSETEWTEASDPSSDLHGGTFSGVSVTNIREEGTVIAFDLDLQGVRAGDPYAYPNPFRPDVDDTATIAFRIPEGERPDRVEVRLFDLGGFLVRALDRRGDEIVVDGDAVRALWNGRNDAGEAVASGTYLYVIAGAGDPKSGKLALLR